MTAQQELRFEHPGRPGVALLSGITGSGKTTFARQMAKCGPLRVSIDEIVFAQHGAYGRDYPEPEYMAFERDAAVVAEEMLRSACSHGRDAVFDHGLWNEADRDRYSRLVKHLGGIPVHIEFQTSRAEIRRRLDERNRRDDADALFVSEDALDDFYARYTPPSQRPGLLDGSCGFAEIVSAFRLQLGRLQLGKDESIVPSELALTVDSVTAAARHCGLPSPGPYNDLFAGGPDSSMVAGFALTLAEWFTCDPPDADEMSALRTPMGIGRWIWER